LSRFDGRTTSLVALVDFRDQALVTANSRGGSLRYLAIATVGIIFLGTPHRGTAAAKWGEIIAFSAKLFGWSTEDRILKDLREDSETLTDLLYEFTLWLFRMSVPTVCFFETHETDYGKRFGFPWKGLVRIPNIVISKTLPNSLVYRW